MTSKQIEKDLNAATARLDELTEMRNGLKTNLDKLQESFIEGKTSLDDLQAEQGKLTILNESIKALEATQSKLHSDYQRASLAESRTATLNHLKTTAEEAEVANSVYLGLRADLDKTLKEFGEKLFEAKRTFFGKQKEFAANFRDLVPGVIYLKDFNHPPQESREEFNRTVAELMECGLSTEKYKLVTSTYQNPPALEYTENVNTLEIVVSNKKEKEIWGERRAARAKA